MSTPNQFAFKITPHWDAANMVLTFETNVSGQLHREAVCFKDRVVREKLIELGWTPPPRPESPPATPATTEPHGPILKTHFRLTWRQPPQRIWEALTPPTMLPTNISFSEALTYLKQGHLIARAGWNGIGMFIYLNKGSSETLSPDRSLTIEGLSESLFDLGDTGTITRLPNINMRAASGSTVTGWLASQTDMLADDWEIVQ